MQTAARGVELAKRTTGFQWSCDNAVVDQFAFHDMRGAADRGFHRGDLAAVELERDVVFASGQIDEAPGTTASAIETTGGSGSYSTTTASAASRALSVLSATTNATGSPT